MQTSGLSFSTPRTPKAYKYIEEPQSPLARFNKSYAPELPSLDMWRRTCKTCSPYMRSSYSSSAASNASSTSKSRRMPSSRNIFDSEDEEDSTLESPTRTEDSVAPNSNRRSPRLQAKAAQQISKSVGDGRRR